MKTLKKILIVLLIIIAIPLLLALFIPKEFNSEGEIVINKPKQEVFEYIKYVKNQDNFGVWQLSDPEMETSSEGTDGTVGFRYSWNSKKLGKGAQVITNIVDGERMESEMFFLDFNDDANKSYLSVEEKSSNETLVKWGILGKTPYPWNLMSLLYSMDKDFDKGLQNLKDILEGERNSTDEKNALHNYYQETFDNLQKSVAGLSKEQLHFKSSATKWSVIECLEHIVISEPLIFDWLKSALDQPENPEKREEITVTDGEVKNMVVDRNYKAEAPADMSPTGKYQDAPQALGDLKSHQNSILNELDNYSMDDLRNHVLDLPTGKADAYQFALFIAGHTARHTAQIEEVKNHKDFPKE